MSSDSQLDPRRRRCEACPADTENEAPWVVAYDNPAAQKFNVCAKHAAEARATGGAVITPAPIGE